MNKLLKHLIQVFLALFILGILYLNIAIYHHPKITKTKHGVINEDLYHQLQFLKNELQQGAATDMQNIFPEGFIFIQALYGLAWYDMARPLKNTHPIYQEAIQELDDVIAQLHSEDGTYIFQKKLPLEYGAFYKGWTSYMIGKRLALQTDTIQDVTLIQTFKKNCFQIKNAIEKSREPYLESYADRTWPADNILCLASIALHDKIFKPQFEKTRKTWLTLIKSHLDPQTKLIPHSVYPNSNRVREGARGSSQSLINNFLLEIDSVFAKEQFSLYKNLFVDYRFGLPGIREYPKGIFGMGDIDSGPVLLQIGGAASIVGMRTLALYGEASLSRGIQSSVEAFGVPFTINQQKFYLFGTLPMADVFIAWANSLNDQFIHQNVTFQKKKFHFLSLIFGLIIVVFLRKI